MDSLDHGEDWFVAAHNSAAAIRFFTNYNGYDAVIDEVTSLLVCEIPKGAEPSEIEFADRSLIKACGGEIKLFDDRDLKEFMHDPDLDGQFIGTSVVLINGTIYVEGSVVRAAAQSLKNQAP